MSRQPAADDTVIADDSTDHHCKLCTNPDNNFMVQCDKCQSWYHFVCVGVTADIENHDWVCSACETAGGARRKRKPSAKQPKSIPAVSKHAIIDKGTVSQSSTGLQLSVDTAKTAILNTSTHAISAAANTPFTHIAPATQPMSNTLVTNTTYPPMTHVTLIPSATATTAFPPITNAVLTNATALLHTTTMPPKPCDSRSVSSVLLPATTPWSTASYLYPPSNTHVYSTVFPPVQCFTVPSSYTQPIPSLQDVTPLSSRNFPVGLPGKTTRIIAPVLTQNNPLDNKTQDRDEVASLHSASSSRRSKKEMRRQLELHILDEERKLEEEEQTKRREYLQKKHNLLRDMAEDSSTDEDEVAEMFPEKVHQWVNQDPQADLNHIQQGGTQIRQCYNVQPQLVGQQEQLPLRSELQYNRQFVHPGPLPSAIENIGANVGGFIPAQRSTPRQTVVVEEDGGNLSRSQVAARQAVSRELPFFSGVPEEWPLFYSTFLTTTNMCGYTPEENLVRLQKCLKGKAYEAVKCRLMHPSNVSGIISTLKMLYGNPEVIIHNLIAKIKTTPPPKSDRMETLIEFSLSVQNLCATIQACQLDEYSYNVVLLHELVDKLPSTIKIDWAKYRRTVPCANLTAFSAWLCDLAEALCPLATLSVVETKMSCGKKDTVYLNAHSEHAQDNRRNISSQDIKPAPPILTTK